MQSSNGCLVTLEGSDGAGKGTQLKLLAERLKAVGYDVAVFDFPRYDEPSSYFVRRYLNGDYGPASKVSPYTASMFFALDRYEASPAIEKALAAGKVVLSNRYTGSNMAHQGGKFKDTLEKRSYFVWADSLEFQLLKIPRPKLSLFLRVPPEVSFDLISKKAERSYTKASHDEHEKDMNHLTQSVATYDLLCQLFPNDFRAIDCTRDGQLLGIPEISDRIWEIVLPLLPDKPAGLAHSARVNLGNLEVKPRPETTSESQGADSSLELNEQISLRLAIDAAGLAPKNFSYDPNWKKTNYGYLKLDGLSKRAEQRYHELLDDIAEAYKKVSKILADERRSGAELSPMTPLAALVAADISVRGDELAKVSKGLNDLGYPEARSLALQLEAEARKIWTEPPRDDGRKPSAQSPEPISAVLSKFAQDHLPTNLSADSKGVKLVNAEPRNEFKAIAASIYPYSHLSLEQVEIEVEEWPYQQKYDALSKAARVAGGPTLGLFHYQFDAVLDQELLAKLGRIFNSNKVKRQSATVRYGYDTPPSLESGVAADIFETCFDKSLELFSILQSAERDELGAYGTLLGHKIRVGLEFSAADIDKLLGNHQPDLQSLAKALVDQIAQAHPTLAEALVPKTRPVQSSQKHRSRSKKS